MTDEDLLLIKQHTVDVLDSINRCLGSVIISDL